MISAKFSYCILMIDSYFPHAIKMCTIQESSSKTYEFCALNCIFTAYVLNLQYALPYMCK
jgi:hypothetical protein